MSTQQLNDTVINLNEFNSSLNFMVYSGSRSESSAFDLLDNDYVEVQVALFNESHRLYTAPDLHMTYCTPEERLRVNDLNDTVKQKAVCLNDRNINLKGNL